MDSTCLVNDTILPCIQNTKTSLSKILVKLTTLLNIEIAYRELSPYIWAGDSLGILENT